MKSPLLQVPDPEASLAHENKSTAKERDGSPKPPAKFLDKKSGQLNTDLLLRSYAELERRLASEGANAGDPRQQALRQLGWPDSADQYDVQIVDDFLSRDPEMEMLLHEAGFTSEQVQLVYDLMAARMLPVLITALETTQVAGDMARLEKEFGGKEGWREAKRQIDAWGKKNLPSNAYDALCCSYEGVMAVHKMMGAGEEPGLGRKGLAGDTLSEETLKRMMNDPRYWRDQDPVLARKVQEGFQRLYPTKG